MNTIVNVNTIVNLWNVILEHKSPSCWFWSEKVCKQRLSCCPGFNLASCRILLQSEVWSGHFSIISLNRNLVWMREKVESSMVFPLLRRSTFIMDDWKNIGWSTTDSPRCPFWFPDVLRFFGTYLLHLLTSIIQTQHIQLNPRHWFCVHFPQKTPES